MEHRRAPQLAPPPYLALGASLLVLTLLFAIAKLPRIAQSAASRLREGIVPRLSDWFAQSPFRQRFESKGRFSAYLAPIPVFVIQANQSPALVGASLALDMPG